jgi:RNA polymerase sigma factor (sigma-70 family)
MSSNSSAFEEVWRRESPHVLGALVRRYGDFDGCEDAVQEAMLAAATRWPRDGMPDNPRSWLIRAASRRLIDAWRSERSRADREAGSAASDPDFIRSTSDVDPPDSNGDHDDSLQVLLLCCHPALTPPSQVALTLRAVGGLTTEQIAAAFLVPVSTMAQRISRAKATLRTAGARFSDVVPQDLPDRVAVARQVLYLIFNEGYTSSGGDQLIDVSLTREAIRLTRDLRSRLPSDPETAGLLALMLLTEARAAARTDDHGDLIALAVQDRDCWNRELITEGVTILEEVLPRGWVGPFQLQAAIAAVHDEAGAYAETDWLQIAELYRMLDQLAPSPTVTMNRAVAVAMADGPPAGLALLDPLAADKSLQDHHRLHAVRAHLLEQAERFADAKQAYLAAARLTTSMPEQRYLNRRAARLAGQA